MWVFLAYELPLREALRLERRLFYGLFATNDQKEGKSWFWIDCSLTFID